jgi:Ca2+-binding RTX toxin-like protein
MNKKWGKTSLSSGLVLAMLIPGVACQSGDVGEETSSEGNEFGVLLEGLGDSITSCVNAGAALTDGTLTLTLADGEDAVLSVVGGKLKVNGHQCMTGGSPNAEITAVLAPKLAIETVAAATNKIVFDLLPGDFGAIFGTTGGITVTVDPAATAVSVGVRGTDGTNNFKMFQDNGGSDLFLELSNNNAADVKIVGDPSSVVFTLGGGADTFNATDATTLNFQGTAQTLRAVQTEPITVYGGAGADTLEGGLGDDVLNGGTENDTFTMLAAGGDGADTYIGGGGTDTVDYSNRTGVGVIVDISPGIARAYVQGGSIYGVDQAAATLDMNFDAVNFVYAPNAPVQGISELLTDLNTQLTGLGVARADDHGRILIVADSPTDPITVNSTSLGFPTGVTFNPGDPDADDGAVGENDDVRADVENIRGTGQDDILTGSILANVIDGNGGNDSISGGPAGTCTGNGAEVDTLNGGTGDDTFPMGAVNNCSDVIDGGPGTDIATYERRTAVLTITLDNTANDGEGSGASGEADNLKGIEVLVGGTLGDTLTGGTGNDEIHGGGGVDTIRGGAGNDTLVGNAGADILNGEAGDDFFNEASAIDPRFELVSTPINAFANNDTIHGGTGFNTCDFRRNVDPGATTNYTLCFSTGTNNCPNGNGNAADGVDGDDLTNCTRLIADNFDDVVTGSVGDDTVEGGDGDDVINGGAGNDTLYGEGGDDALNGEGGVDTVDGGADQDTANINGGDGEGDICVSPGPGPGVALNCEF